MEASISLHSLPLDILHHLAGNFLSLHGVVVLSSTSKYYRRVVYENDAFWMIRARCVFTANNDALKDLKEGPLKSFKDFYSYNKELNVKLIAAIRYGYEIFLFSHVSHIRTLNEWHLDSLLNNAALRGRVDIYNFLLRETGKTNIDRFWRDIGFAINSRNLEMVICVMKNTHRGNANFRRTLQDAFVYSLREHTGDFAISNYLLHQGASLDDPDHNGNTPMNVALRTHVDNVKCLMNHGVKLSANALRDVISRESVGSNLRGIVLFLVEEQNQLPTDIGPFRILINSTCASNLDIIPYLIWEFLRRNPMMRGKSAKRCILNGCKSLLEKSIKSVNPVALKYFFEHGIKMQTEKETWGMSRPYYLTMAIQMNISGRQEEDRLEIVKLLIKNGADTSSLTENDIAYASPLVYEYLKELPGGSKRIDFQVVSRGDRSIFH